MHWTVSEYEGGPPGELEARYYFALNLIRLIYPPDLLGSIIA